MIATHASLKIALFAIALSPYVLNAEMTEELMDEEQVVYAEDEEMEDSFYGDDEITDASSPQQMQNSDESAQDPYCRSPFHVMHVGVRHTEARGVGYDKGYTTLEGFGICDGNPYFMPFLDLRFHVFNNGKVAGNVGIGERTMIPSINHLFGLYFYYDVRQANHGLSVINQVSPGIELVGRRMEYRINGYFPVGRDKGDAYGYKFSRFDGNHILLKHHKKFAMTGGDAEVGVHITQSTKYDLYAGAGPYYFSSEHASSWGGKTRLLGRYKEYVFLEASYSYDSMFSSVVQGTIAFNYPFGRKLKRKDRNCPQKNDLAMSRAAFAPYRFEIPVVKRKTIRTKAINPATGAPWKVWFVNNTSSSSGTIESPFPTLLQAQNASSPNDMIYVFQGDGTTNGMAAGITLQDGQSFFGSGTKQHFQTTHGTMTIPQFSDNMPSIAGGVTTGNNNVISGFNVTSGTVGNAVATNLTNLTVINNQIAAGIGFQGSGNVYIANNTITGLAGPSSPPSGINLFAAPGSLITGEISNNTLNLATMPNIGNGILLANVDENNPGLYNFSVSNNMINNYPTAFNSTVLGTNSSVAVTGNTMSILRDVASVNSVIVFQNNLQVRNGQSGNILIADNNVTVASNVGGNAAIAIYDNSIPASPVFLEKVTIQNNTLNLTPAIRSGIQFIMDNAVCAIIDNNTVTPVPGSPPSSFFFFTGNNGIINIASFENNTGTVTTTGSNINFAPAGTCGN